MNNENFLILYFINILLGVLFGSLLYCFGINVLFAFLFVYFNGQKYISKPKEIEHVNEPEPPVLSRLVNRPKPIKEVKTEPSPDDNVYTGVEISKEEYDRKVKEQSTWYSKMTDQLDKGVDKLHKFFDTENGNK